MNILPRVSFWLATSCLVAAGAPAFAQTAQTPPTSPTGGVGEVVVTAQRRSERLQDVPIAVSVVTADTLSVNNFNSLNDLQQISPAVTYNEAGASFQIRGVGTQSQNGSAEQDVAVVVDDIIQGINEINHGYPYYNALSDIDRVEVLEGPQGTLFGKNSSAGVLNIVTKRPVLEKFEDDATISYGSKNEIKVSDVINIPLGDKFALRASAYSNQQQGIGYNVINGQKVGSYIQAGFDLKLLWKPIEKFSAYLILEDRFTRTNDAGAASIRSCGSGNGPYNPCATGSGFPADHTVDDQSRAKLTASALLRLRISVS